MAMITKIRQLLHRRGSRQGHVDQPGEIFQTGSKTFSGDLAMFNQKLASAEPFSLVRFGDGEMKIIQGEFTDLSAKANGEHRYQPGNPIDEQQRQYLADSLHYQNDRYYVGIACPCCVGFKNFEQLKAASAQPDMQLTWANIFVNANYKTFLEETTPLFSKRKIVLVCHEKAQPDNLPFSVEKQFSTAGNAWINDHQRLTSELGAYLRQLSVNEPSTGRVVLFCAGVLSNILIKEMTEQYPDHTFIDTGSVYDSMLGLGKTRKYLKGSKNLRKVCVWG